MSRTSPPHLRVERALALVPDGEEFLPLAEAVIASSARDRDKVWARSAAYATLGKRLLDADRLAEMLPEALARAQERLAGLYARVVEAVRLQQSGDVAGAATALIRAGEVEEGDGRLAKAERIYAFALELSRDLRDRGPEVLALRRLGRAARAAGRLDDAYREYQRSLELALDQMDAAGEAIACQGLGNVCDDRGEREAARRWYERGLEIARGLDDPSLEWPFYTNLSVIAIKHGELAEAEALLARARERIEATGADDAMPFYLNNRGLLLTEHGDLDGAEAVFREALARALEPRWAATVRCNLGDVLLRRDRLFEAEEEARAAEEAAIVHGLLSDLVDVYLLLGGIARARADEEGFVFYEQALNVCHERGLPRKQEAAVLHGYGLLHAACGRPAEARAYLDAAREIFAAIGLAPELAALDRDLSALTPEPVAAD